MGKERRRVQCGHCNKVVGPTAKYRHDVAKHHGLPSRWTEVGLTEYPKITSHIEHINTPIVSQSPSEHHMPLPEPVDNLQSSSAPSDRLLTDPPNISITNKDCAERSSNTTNQNISAMKIRVQRNDSPCQRSGSTQQVNRSSPSFHHEWWHVFQALCLQSLLTEAS